MSLQVSLLVQPPAHHRQSVHEPGWTVTSSTTSSPADSGVLVSPPRRMHSTPSPRSVARPDHNLAICVAHFSPACSPPPPVCFWSDNSTDMTPPPLGRFCPANQASSLFYVRPLLPTILPFKCDLARRLLHHQKFTSTGRSPGVLIVRSTQDAPSTQRTPIHASPNSPTASGEDMILDSVWLISPSSASTQRTADDPLPSSSVRQRYT